MLVSELFESEKIEKSHVENVGDESDYWQKASGFVIDNWDRRIDTLSPKQAKWLDQIHEELTERRIEGKLC